MRLHLPTLALVATVAGVAVASWLPPLFVIAIASPLVVVGALCFAQNVRRSTNARDGRFIAVPMMILGLFVLLGAFRYAVIPDGVGTAADVAGGTRVLRGTVIRHERGRKGEQATLTNIDVDGRRYAGGVLLRALPRVALPLGARVSVSCALEAPEPFDGFAYDRYLHAKNIWAICDARSEPFIMNAAAISGPVIAIRRWHDVLAASIDRSFVDPQAALLRGLLLGDNAFSDEWKEIFRRTGTSHIVAASGSNVTLVASLAFGILIGFGLHRRHAVPLLLLAIWAFAVVAGLGAAVTRAAVMSTVVFAARETRRVTAPWRPLLLAVVLMLLWNPRLLRDDVGFQLSIFATAGLLLWTRSVERRLSLVPESFGVREALASTLAATLGTVPVMLLSFDTVSIIAPLANLFVLPWLPSAMLFGAGGTLLSAALPWLGPITALPGHAILLVITSQLRFFAALPFAVVMIPFPIRCLLVLWWCVIARRQLSTVYA